MLTAGRFLRLQAFGLLIHHHLFDTFCYLLNFQFVPFIQVPLYRIRRTTCSFIPLSRARTGSGVGRTARGAVS